MVCIPSAPLPSRRARICPAAPDGRRWLAEGDVGSRTLREKTVRFLGIPVGTRRTRIEDIACEIHRLPMRPSPHIAVKQATPEREQSSRQHRVGNCAVSRSHCELGRADCSLYRAGATVEGQSRAATSFFSHSPIMIRTLFAVFLFALAGCRVSHHTIPLTLVEFVIDGSPRLGPGGPALHVDGLYRGHPVDGRFRIELPVGRHDVRLLRGAEVYWQGELAVIDIADPQVFEIRYNVPISGG
jgi:hypothetical protein